MKRWLAAGILAAMLCLGVQVVSAAPVVPEDIFQWVQSSSRANYYFNKQQICFAVDADGYIDTNLLIVPTLKTYDDVQIQDVVDKRRWKMQRMAGYNKLVGAAEYLRINRAKRIVNIEEIDDLDDTWTTLSAEHPNEAITLDKLSEKNVDRVFYEAILSYAKDHQDEIIAQTNGQVKPGKKKDEKKK